MTAPSVRLLSRADLDGAYALSSTAGWNQRPDDWLMLLDLAPRGAFGAIAGGRLVGTAIGIDYETFGWIAMMLVEPAFRGRGIGRRLLQAAMDALPADRGVRLDATPMGRPLYEAHGFRLESTLTRYVSEAAVPAAPEPDPAKGAAQPAVPMTPRDLDPIGRCDRLVFRGNRGPVLAWALDMAPRSCHVLRVDGELAGYVLGRHGRLFHQIGPVVATSDTDAHALADAAVRAIGSTPVIVDAFEESPKSPGATTDDTRPAREADLGGWLRTHGFTAQRPLFRMCRPGSASREVVPSAEPPLVEYAIFGPEFA